MISFLLILFSSLMFLYHLKEYSPYATSFAKRYHIQGLILSITIIVATLAYIYKPCV